MEQFIYKGRLEIDAYGVLTCNENYLIDDISYNCGKGDKIFVRYYISDKEITEEEGNKSLLINSFGGEIDDLSFILEAYSEWTIIDYEEEFYVGGHDLNMELRDYEGRYLLLIIEKVN